MPVDRAKVQQDADRLVRQGKVDEAIGLYEQLLQDSPRDMNIKSRIGDLHFRAGSIVGAVRILREVAEFYEQEGFHLKAVAIRKRIGEIGAVPATKDRRQPAATERQAPSTVLPFVDPAAAEPAGAARARSSAPEVPAESPEDDRLLARFSETIDRLRKVQAERVRLQERLAVIEQKRAETLAHVYEKVRKDGMVKLGALEQVLASCAKEVQAIRTSIEQERLGLKRRLGILETELEEIRFLQNIGDYSREESARKECAKLLEVEASGRRAARLSEAAAELDRTVGPSRPAPVETEVSAASTTSPVMAAAVAAADPAAVASPVAVPVPVASTPAAAPESRRAGEFRPALLVRWKMNGRQEEWFDLAPGANRIGRGDHCEVQVFNNSLSRLHACLRIEDGGAWIEELGSVNGTEVNEEPLSREGPRKLGDGDVIRFGNLEAVFRTTRPADPER